MLDSKYSSKEWDKLWKELDNIKTAPSFAEQTGKNYDFKHSKVTVNDFGIGASMMGNYQDPVKGLQAEIRRGSGHIEFNPAISGQGMKSFSKVSAEKRRALREIKKVNNVTIGTHVDSNVFGLTGFDTQRYSFSEDKRHQNVAKIKEAIDFAADVSEGGAITFHAGDFVRPISHGNFGKSFSGSIDDEQKDLVLGIIDETNNEFVRESMVRPNERLTVAVKTKDKSNKISLEEFGNKYYIPGFEEVQREDGKKTVKTESFNNFREYAAWLYEQGDPDFKKIVNKQIGESGVQIKKFDDKNKRAEISDYRILELAARQKFVDDNRFQLLNTANNQFSQIGKQLREVETLKEAVEEAKKKSIEEGEKYFVPKDMRQGKIKAISYSDLIGQLSSKNHEVSDERLKEVMSDFIVIEGNKYYDENNKEISESQVKIDGFYAGDYSLSHLSNRLNEIKFLKENVKSQIEDKFEKLGPSGEEQNSVYKTITEISQKQNQKSFAELGIALNEKNKMLAKQGKDQLYFAIENIFPEHYGSTPEELLNIINTAKKSMANELKEHNYSEKDAKKIADSSIKATFDTGHLHMWKKYFKRDPNWSDEEYDKKFNKWALDETKKLVESGVIGNVHLADNFGHEDDHLTLGQGTVPINEYMALFDKARSEGKITGKFSVEGFDDSGERHGITEAWKQSGVQIFRGQEATDKWVNLDDDFGKGYSFSKSSDSYLNNTSKPYFIFGKYSPSQDPNDWAPWDEMGLE